MVNRNVIRQLANVLLPTVIFYVLYLSAGILPAMAASLLVLLFNAVYTYRKERRLPNTQLFGLIGLAFSTVAVIFTDNEKLYYIPGLVNNCVLFCFAVGLTLKHQSILHYVTRDFHIDSLKKVSEASLFSVNLVWCLFFFLKILSKALGILFLDFKALYWLVFILGDPMTVVVVVYSIYRINCAVQKDEPVSATEPGE